MPQRNGLVVWFTGLSGSGKTTLARAVSSRLGELGWSVEVIDGDDLRMDLSARLGFSKSDREENVRRAACLAKAHAKRADFVLVAMIAPYRALRASVAAKLPTYREIYVNAPLAICEARDPKGLYSRVRAGTLKNFTGVDDIYEPPLTPALVCRTDRDSVEQSIQNVLSFITNEIEHAESRVEMLRSALDREPALTMATFAKRIGVTPRALALGLRRNTNTNFRTIRDERLFMRAQELLGRTCEIKLIASDLGFGSTTSFYRFFRRLSKCSPTGFRDKQRKKTNAAKTPRAIDSM